MRKENMNLTKSEFIDKTRKMYLDNGYKESEKFPGRFVYDEDHVLMITAHSLEAMFEFISRAAINSKLNDEDYIKCYNVITSKSCRLNDLDEFGNKKPGEYVIAPYLEITVEQSEEMKHITSFMTKKELSNERSS